MVCPTMQQPKAANGLYETPETLNYLEIMLLGLALKLTASEIFHSAQTTKKKEDSSLVTSTNLTLGIPSHFETPKIHRLKLKNSVPNP
jgi:hypothetical protein